MNSEEEGEEEGGWSEEKTGGMKTIDEGFHGGCNGGNEVIIKGGKNGGGKNYGGGGEKNDVIEKGGISIAGQNNHQSWKSFTNIKLPSMNKNKSNWNLKGYTGNNKNESSTTTTSNNSTTPTSSRTSFEFGFLNKSSSGSDKKLDGSFEKMQKNMKQNFSNIVNTIKTSLNNPVHTKKNGVLKTIISNNENKSTGESQVGKVQQIGFERYKNHNGKEESEVRFQVNFNF